MVGTLKRTPLYQRHQELGGKIVPFAGWELPVLYSSVIAEHHAVREKAGLFDVSHMGEVIVSGPEAEAALQYLTCNDLKQLNDGKAQYTAIINEQGGVVDDIIIYRFSPERFFICVNASNADKDFSWFTTHNRFQARFENVSSQFGQIALQGPQAEAIVTAMGASSFAALKTFHFAEGNLAGSKVIAARTGYTGEDGFEFFIPWNETTKVWNSLLESGKAYGLVPAGLGARDSLRLEACYPLHGHELGDDISAIESGLAWIVKFDKGDFSGKKVLQTHKTEGAPRALVGFFVDDPGIVRHTDKIFSEDGREVGVTTSGTKTPTINRALGLALVKKEFSAVGTRLYAEVRGKRLACTVVKKPFYKR